MTWSELKDFILTQTEAGAIEAFAEPNLVTNLLIEAEKDFVIRTGCLKKTDTETVLAQDDDSRSTTYVSTPSDLIRFTRMEWEGSPLDAADIENIGNLFNNDDEYYTGTPKEYFVQGEELWLVPGNASAGTLRYWYVYLPAGTGDSPEIPAGYHLYLPNYVISKALQARGLSGQAKQYMGYYLNDINQALLQERQKDHAPGEVARVSNTWYA